MISKFEPKVMFFDLGSHNSRAYSVERGLINDFPSFLLRESASKKVAFVGQEAIDLAEKVPLGMELVVLFEKGLIADPQLSVLITSLIDTELEGWKSKLIKPIAVLAVQSNFYPVYQRALKKALVKVGFGKVVFYPTSAAVAMSANQNVLAHGGMVVDLGAGKTEISILSADAVLQQNILAQGGNDLDKLIQDFFEVHSRIKISLADSRLLKHDFAFEKKKQKRSSVIVRNLESMIIETVQLDSSQIKSVVELYFENIANEISVVCKRQTPAMMKKIEEQGILLTGGLSQIEGLDQWLSMKLKIKVTRIARQNLASILGVIKFWQSGDKYSHLQIKINA